jgi:ABC-type transport system involved in multi-copper enzyme maturation permease subunit
MKALIYKELRENLKLALPGFLVLTLVLFRLFQNSETQPLLSVAVLRPIEFFCFAIGVGLGWFQIHNERHRDLWAFLVHRPLTRSQIFAAKVTAGLSLYIVAVGLPLLGLIAASSRTGEFASPFEWEMALPVAADFLFGVVWYFAGLLTSLRRARWYASRGLPLLAALLVSILASIQPSSLPGFWQQHVVLFVGGVILAIAAWGVFLSDGSHRSQPAWGRLATTGVLIIGVTLVSLLFQGFFEILLRGNHAESSRFEMTRDGTVYEIIERTGKPAEIIDLAGKPLIDSATGRKMNLAIFDKLVAESYAINADFGDQSKVRNLLRQSSRFYCLWQNVDRVDWFWTREGRLVGYDTVTKLPVSYIEPMEKAHFLRPQSEIEPDEENDARDRNVQSTQALATAHEVYEINQESAIARRIFSVSEDQIGGACSIGDGTIVVTKCFVKMIDANGALRWQMPHTSVGRPFWVKVSRLDGEKGYAVWVGDYHPANRRNMVSLRRYTEVTIVSNDGGAVKNVKLEPTGKENRQALQTWSYRISSIFMPPLPIVYQLLGWQSVPWDLLRISFGAAFVCALIGWQLGKRYHYEISGQVKWLVFHLLFGFPGLMAFLCVQEWPARECCANCKRMRVVDRARCEYCDAEFAPARRNGTEIFEPLEVIR